MGIAEWVRQGLAHTRFVPTPLYRLLVLGQILAGAAQIAFGVPVSIAENSPMWFNWVFAILSLVGGLTALAGLYFVDGNKHNSQKLHASLYLELLGLIMVQTAITINVVGVFYQLGTPTSGGTWFQMMFWCWGWFRVGAILKATRELTR